MKAILLAAAVALGLSTGVALSASPPKGALSTDAKPATGGKTTQLLNTMDTVPAGRGLTLSSLLRPARTQPGRCSMARTARFRCLRRRITAVVELRFHIEARTNEMASWYA
jgi:hypothetical protein